MPSLFIKLFNVFSKRKWLFFLCLGALITASIFSISGLRIESNIYSALPQSSEFKKFSSVAKDNVSREILFGLNIQNVHSNDVRDKMEGLGTLLEREAGEYVEDIEFDFSDREKKVANFFIDNIYYFLDDEDYKNLENHLSEVEIKERVEDVSAQLKSINSLFSKEFIIKDPLRLGLNKLKDFKNSSFSPISNEDGILINKQSNYALLKGRITSDLSYDEKFKLAKILEEINDQTNEDFLYFNPIIYENANAKAIDKDTIVTLTITVILLIILLFYFYRNIGVTIFFLISVGLSALFGLGIVSLFKDQISGLAIAASSVLLGIVVDYTFHVITHYSKERDLRSTIKTITNPLLIGSFTTVLAFASLMQVESSILNDFGLLALCTLSSAAFISLGVLPVIIKTFNLKISNNEISREFTIPKLLKKLVLLSILTSIVFCFIHPPNPNFDKDIKNLGYFPDDLKKVEQKITGISPDIHKSLLIFIEDKTLEGALEKSSVLQDHLISYDNNSIAQITSPARFTIAPTMSKERAHVWNEFWADKSERVKEKIEENTRANGFRDGVFSNFTDKISGIEAAEEIDHDLAKYLGLDKFITETKNGFRIATSLIIIEDSLTTIKSSLPEIDGLYIFDTSEIASAVLKSVSEDFNYLLLFTSLLVFFSLVVLYGRLELALFSFFPMVVIWIWVLYIASIFEISFNFVNVLLATIIFGLGDDYSIFVTDGLLKKYKGNRGLIKTFNTAIVLSALTTTIGTGVLFFARHPSVNSIAAMSVVGMLSIVLMTLVVQPIIFDAFILKRVQKGFKPITLTDLLITILDFGTFLFGVITLNLLACIFLFIPISKTAKRRILNFFIYCLANFILKISIHIKNKQFNYEKFDFKKPSIIISNHVSFVDIILALSLSPKVVLVAKEWVSNIPFMGFVMKYSGHITLDDGGGKLMDEIKDRISEGYSILFFPEGTRSPNAKIQRFHKGAFHTSKELKVDIHPILFIGCEFVSPKGDWIIKRGTMNVHVLDRIQFNDTILDNRLGVVAKHLKDLMKNQLQECRKSDYDMPFMGNRIFYNYIYKGTILEWYFKVKWKIESNNYSFCDEIIAKRNRIYDLGTGYGYLSFFLHYKDEDRRITGIDYDKEKIFVAAKSAFKTKNLDFVQSKVEDVEFEDFDACILYDILHYINPEKRIELFKKLSLKINPDGVIIVRDGITNFKESHGKTKLTEFISTKVLKFNKIVNELNFMSIEEIEHLAQTYNLEYEIKNDSKSMSNVLIVFRKAQ